MKSGRGFRSHSPTERLEPQHWLSRSRNYYSSSDALAERGEKGKLAGAKPPLSPKHVWAILQLWNRLRDLALFNLAVDSKLRGCDLVGLNR